MKKQWDVKIDGSLTLGKPAFVSRPLQKALMVLSIKNEHIIKMVLVRCALILLHDAVIPPAITSYKTYGYSFVGHIIPIINWSQKKLSNL